MSDLSMGIYGYRARTFADTLQATARLPMQREGERRAILDIAGKLDLRASDTLLDIGCGVGNLTIPLSYLVRQTTAVDHPDVLARLHGRYGDMNIDIVSGNFLTDNLVLGSVDKILVYATLHYLANADSVERFIVRALGLLNPHGRALFGDLPNADSKIRFLSTTEGGTFDAEYRRWFKDHPEWGESETNVPIDYELVAFDDALCLRLVALARSFGCHAYLVPQPSDLPFGHVREDLLVIRP